MANGESFSHQDLRGLAMLDAHNRGKGRVNAILALPLKRVTDHYLSMSPEERTNPIRFDHHRPDETVPVILDGISMPKYRRLW